MDVNVESEAMLEEKFIEQLQGMGYEFIKIKNEEELNANFKIQLEKLNKKNLMENQFLMMNLIEY